MTIDDAIAMLTEMKTNGVKDPTLSVTISGRYAAGLSRDGTESGEVICDKIDPDTVRMPDQAFKELIDRTFNKDFI